MFWSQFFIPTIKEVPVGTEAISHQLSLRAGLVNMLTSGVYSYLPLGLRVLNRVESIIREEMTAAGANELFLPCLQPRELWKASGRDPVLDEIMIRFTDNRGKEMCLGPTHEEVITELAKNYVQSYRQLPVTLYQIQTKFRDELRPRFGIVRACEFIMKDAYSFDRDTDGLQQNYQKMYEAYQRVFARCALPVVIAEADSGAMGGDVSHEFLIPAEIGEDEVVICPECGFSGGLRSDRQEGTSCPQCSQAPLGKKAAIELGHVFQLGTKYSQSLGALFVDEDGQQKPMIMGCYGIGVSRLIAAIIEVHHDDKGICWPPQVAPFDVEILPLQMDDEETVALARRCCDELSREGYSVLVDDRAESPGRKFNDADLIGIPLRIVLGKKGMKEGKLEFKIRKDGQVVMSDQKDCLKTFKDLVRSLD